MGGLDLMNFPRNPDDPANPEGSDIPEGGCKLTVEYSALLSKLHHEQLVAKAARTPNDLNQAEKDYLAEWTTPAIGKQYAIARFCKSTYSVDEENKEKVENVVKA